MMMIKFGLRRVDKRKQSHVGAGFLVEMRGCLVQEDAVRLERLLMGK